MKVEWKGMAIFILIVLLIISIRLILGERMEVPSKYTVAMVSGTTYPMEARKLPKVKEIKHFPDVSRVLDEVAKGRADAAIVDRLTGLNLIKENQYRNLIVTGDLLESEALTITFNREDRKLRQTINQALTEIIHNGTYARISRRYFGRNILEGLKRGVTPPDEPAAADGSWSRVQQAGAIHFAMKGANPPFNYYNDQHELFGFEVELAQAVCKHLGLKFVAISATEDVVVEGLRAKYFDGIWGRVKITEEQLKDLDFSEPYLFTGPQLIVRDNFMITVPGIFERKILTPFFRL
jgi:ABC-type amino acid transport substrate-binding protein